MTDFMTHQKVIDGAACLLPHRQGQHTSVDIKAGSLHLLVLNHQVLSGKEFSKLGLDFVADGHCSVAYERIIQKNPAFWARSCAAS